VCEVGRGSGMEERSLEIGEVLERESAAMTCDGTGRLFHRHETGNVPSPTVDSTFLHGMTSWPRPLESVTSNRKSRLSSVKLSRALRWCIGRICLMVAN